jgi:hypothetical protein
MSNTIPCRCCGHRVLESETVDEICKNCKPKEVTYGIDPNTDAQGPALGKGRGGK